MRIALIGGAGFAGHHLALALRGRGHEVMVADGLIVNHIGPGYEKRRSIWDERYLRMLGQRMDLLYEAGVEFRHVDARDYHRLSRAVAPFVPDAIVHLAAVAHITVTKQDQHLAWEHSVGTLKNALDVAVGVQCPHFVYLSSSTVYGNFQRPVIDESEPLAPDTTYGAFKQIGEIMVRRWQADHKLPCTIVRPQALYGPRCVSRRVTHIFAENALSGLPLKIDGDGSASHDFTHVDDLVAGIVAILSRPERSRGETFCLTAGEAHTLTELAGYVKAAVPSTEVEYGPPDPEKPSRGTMSPLKAKALLGWEPKWTLEAGMRHLLDWYTAFLAEENRNAA